MNRQLYENMRGAVVVDSPSISGVSKVAIKQSIYLKYPLIALCGYKPWRELLALVPNFTYLSDMRLPRLYRTVNILFSIYWKKIDLGAELYITHQLSSSWFAYKRRLSYIAYIHDLLYSPIPINMFTCKYLRRLEKKILENAKLVICNSTNTHRQIKESYGIEAIIVEPGTEIPENISYDKRENAVLMVFRLIELKRVYNLIRNLAEEFPSLKFYICGASHRLAKKYVKKLSDLGNVAIEKDVSEARLFQLYSRVKILLHPIPENFALQPLEAMASGTVPIVHEECGVCRLFEHGIHGYKFRYFDDISKYIAEVLEHYPNMGIEARKHVIRNDYTWQNHCKRMRRLLEVIKNAE